MASSRATASRVSSLTAQAAGGRASGLNAGPAGAGNQALQASVGAAAVSSSPGGCERCGWPAAGVKTAVEPGAAGASGGAAARGEDGAQGS